MTATVAMIILSLLLTSCPKEEAKEPVLPDEKAEAAEARKDLKSAGRMFNQWGEEIDTE